MQKLLLEVSLVLAAVCVSITSCQPSQFTEAARIAAAADEAQRRPLVELGEALLGQRPVTVDDLPDLWQQLSQSDLAGELATAVNDADEYFSQREDYRAEKLYRDIRLGAIYLNNADTALHALNRIISTVQWTNRFDQQWQVLQLAAAEAAVSTSPLLRGETAQIHAEYFADLRLWRNATGFYADAYREYDAGGNLERKRAAALEMADLMINKAGLVDEAIAFSEEYRARALASKREDQDYLKELMLAGRLARSSAEYEDAMEFFKEARYLADELGDDSLQADALRQLANTLWGIGEVYDGVNSYNAFSAIAANSADVHYDHWNDAQMAKMLLAAGDDAGAMALQQIAWENALAAEDWPSQFQRHLAEFAEHAGWMGYMQEIVCSDEPASQSPMMLSPEEPAPPHGVTPGMVDMAIRCFARKGETNKARDLVDYMRRSKNKTGMWIVCDLDVTEGEVLVLQAEAKHGQAVELQRSVVEEYREMGVLHYMTDQLYLLAQLESAQGNQDTALAVGGKAFEMDTSLISELYYGTSLLHFAMQDINRDWMGYLNLLKAAGQMEKAKQVNSAYIAVQRLRNLLLAGFPDLDPTTRDLLVEYRRLQSLRRRILDEYFDYRTNVKRHQEYLRTYYYAPADFIAQFDAEYAQIQDAMRLRADELAVEAEQVLEQLAALDPELVALIRLEGAPDTIAAVTDAH